MSATFVDPIDGMWSEPRRVSDCPGCPFFDTSRHERMPVGGCAVNGHTVRPFTAEEDRADGPPAWCPLRLGAIRVEFGSDE